MIELLSGVSASGVVVQNGDSGGIPGTEGWCTPPVHGGLPTLLRLPPKGGSSDWEPLWDFDFPRNIHSSLVTSDLAPTIKSRDHCRGSDGRMNPHHRARKSFVSWI